jgi:hypothetical protein
MAEVRLDIALPWGAAELGPVVNDFRRDDYGILVERDGYAIEKRASGSGVSGWFVTNRSRGRMWTGKNLTFRSAAAIFRALLSGRKLPSGAFEEAYTAP